jgi:hypothetical protein
MVETLTQHFPEFRGLPVTTLPYVEASCEHIFDGTRYSVHCQAETMRVEIIWEELLDQKHLNWPQFPAGPVAYDLTTVICPCRAGYVKLNGVAVPGEVQQGQAADGHPSSPFSAFAESYGAGGVANGLKRRENETAIDIHAVSVGGVDGGL